MKSIRLSTKSLPRGDWDRKRWDDFLADKEEMLDEIFKEASRQKLESRALAEKARLSYSTIRNLERYREIVGRHTGNVMMSTVWKLAKAVGLKLEVTKRRAKLRRRAA